jgi:hypothetical protein
MDTAAFDAEMNKYVRSLAGATGGQHFVLKRGASKNAD